MSSAAIVSSSVSSTPSPALLRSGILIIYAIDASFEADVLNTIRSTIRFSKIDEFNGQTGTPTSLQILTYQAIFVYTSGSLQSSPNMGDVLADYIDSGGRVGVAIGVFGTTARALTGRFASGGYSPLVLQSQLKISPQLQLAAVHPNDPLSQGVSSFDGGSASFQYVTTLTTSAVLVASWTDGITLIARKISPNGLATVVALNFFPPSNKVPNRSNYWNSATDGGTMIANALQAVLTS